jgi:hypothetical protein
MHEGNPNSFVILRAPLVVDDFAGRLSNLEKEEAGLYNALTVLVCSR